MFKNRNDAAKRLVEILPDNDIDIIIGIPRGGTIIAEIISNEIKIKYSSILCKKISNPFNCEIAIGAVAQDGSIYINKEICERLNISDEYIENKIQLLKHNFEEIKNQIQFEVPENKKILLVDDGAATGYTLAAACRMLRRYNNAIYIAVPVLSGYAYEILIKECKDIFSVIMAPHMEAVSLYYEAFEQIEEDAINLFKQKNNYSNI
jgi:putative phosphoribosyl transferase